MLDIVVHIQETDEGYDFSVFQGDLQEVAEGTIDSLDGGVYEGSLKGVIDEAHDVTLALLKLNKIRK